MAIPASSASWRAAVSLLETCSCPSKVPSSRAASKCFALWPQRWAITLNTAPGYTRCGCHATGASPHSEKLAPEVYLKSRLTIKACVPVYRARDSCSLIATFSLASVSVSRMDEDNILLVHFSAHGDPAF